jgi:hypothetical protein
MWHAWERRMYKVLAVMPEVKNDLEDQGVDGRMGSEWILGILPEACRVYPVGSGYGPVAGSCEYDNEPSGSGATESVFVKIKQR